MAFVDTLRFVDADAAALSPVYTLAADSIGPPIVVPHRDRTVALWLEVREPVGLVVIGQAFVGSEPRGEPVHVTGRLQHEPQIVAVAIRDRIALVGVAVERPSFELTMIDPERLSAGASRDIGRAVGVNQLSLVAAPEEGLVVACTAGRGGIEITLAGLDGRRWGTSLRIPTRGSMACGWNGSEVMIVWDDEREPDRERATVTLARARPTFL